MAASIFLSCKEEKVPEKFYPRNDHEAYGYSLRQANLDKTALGKDWVAAGRNVYDAPIKIQLPYLEALHLDTRKPEALSYRFEVRRGQKVSMTLKAMDQDSAIVFMDVFRILDDSLQQYKHIASADSAHQVAFEPRADAAYLLRLQPELLRGGAYTLRVEIGPSFAFPVAGKSNRAIQSFFGDPRDGGRREHHGVDIFAKRHTPIIAPVDGYVRFVGVKGLGGKVIWIRDDRGHNLYFAHLDSQWVKARTYVETGDTLGTVGNTGNARFTPPHLHFGIYRNGPINPYPFIAKVSRTPKPYVDDIAKLGETTSVPLAFLREGQSTRSVILDTLVQEQPFRITGIVEKRLRVKTLEGLEGYISYADLD